MTMLRLRLRAWLGWGRPQDDLRVQSAQLFRAVWVGVVGYGLLLPLFFFIAGMFYEPFGAFTRNLLTTRFGLIYGGLLLALTLCLLIPAMSYRRLAQRGEAQPPTIISGRCFEVVQGKSDIFARIGDSVELAQWYHLPLAWEAVVETGASGYERTVNPATGFVERLRRLGEAPKELRQSSAMEVETGQAGESYHLKKGEQDEDTCRATDEQFREVKRTLRAFGPALGLSPQIFLICSIIMVILGFICLGLTIWSAFVLYTADQTRFAPGAAEAGAIYIGFIVALAMAVLGYGFYLFWIWHRTRRLEHEESAQVEGVTIYWTPYGNPLNERRADTLVQMRADDGSTQVFRVHRRWENRVRTPNQRFRVTYLPTTHRVLDVCMVDNPTADKRA
jgi:hypothetical protein